MVAIFFKTYGCQANVADSQGLITYLESLGCKNVSTEAEADMIIVNTCAIREKAESKMFSYLGGLVEYKAKKPYLRLGIIGCVASYRKKEIYQRFDHVNFVFGAREDLGMFQRYLFDAVTKLETAKQFFASDDEAEGVSAGQDRDIASYVAHMVDENKVTPVVSTRQTTQVALGGKVKEDPKAFRRSFINITSGCNNYCTYCIVPFTRGREKSYSIASIIERVKKDVAAGAKEITLVGQNVNSYQCPETEKRFAILLESVARVPGEFWIRYISPHPKDMTNDVLQVMAAYREKVCGWVHLPLQAGSDTILEAMNRTYTVAEYMQQVNWIRQIIPHATITSDIIVGFPGETEEDYQGTRKVMELVKFDFVFSFIYSRRKYTKAYKMGDPCPSSVKSERLTALQARQKEIGLERNRASLGTTSKVLVEKRLADDRLLARTEGNIRVLFSGSDELINQFVYVTIEHAGRVNLEGSLAQNTSRKTLQQATDVAV